MDKEQAIKAEIKTYTPLQINRAQLFADLLTKMRFVRRVMTEHDISTFISTTAYGRLDVNRQFLYGMGIAAQSLWEDLANDGERETADGIIEQHKRQYEQSR